MVWGTKVVDDRHHRVVLGVVEVLLRLPRRLSYLRPDPSTGNAHPPCLGAEKKSDGHVPKTRNAFFMFSYVFKFCCLHVFKFCWVFWVFFLVFVFSCMFPFPHFFSCFCREGGTSVPKSRVRVWVLGLEDSWYLETLPLAQELDLAFPEPKHALGNAFGHA